MVGSAPDGDDERLGRRSAQAKWQVRTCAPDAPDADRELVATVAANLEQELD